MLYTSSLQVVFIDELIFNLPGAPEADLTVLVSSSAAMLILRHNPRAHCEHRVEDRFMLCLCGEGLIRFVHTSSF